MTQSIEWNEIPMVFVEKKLAQKTFNRMFGQKLMQAQKRILEVCYVKGDILSQPLFASYLLVYRHKQWQRPNNNTANIFNLVRYTQKHANR